MDQRLRLLAFAVALSVGAAPAFAQQTEATGTNTVSPTLQVSATVAQAIRLTLSTGSDCAFTAVGFPATGYTMDFGTVDALGISNGACGSKFEPTTPGATPAVYYSDYTLRPMFASQSTTNNTISAYVSTDFTTAAGLLAIVQGQTAGGIGDLTDMSKVPAAPTTIATNTASGTEITRYIGVSVSPLNGPGTLAGGDQATITYTLTVQ